MKIITVRFKRLLFDCASSLFMLDGTLKKRFEYFKEKENNTVADHIKRNFHAIDIDLLPARDDKVEIRKLR